MDRSTAETVVKIWAILFWVFGALSLLGALMIFTLGGAAVSNMTDAIVPIAGLGILLAALMLAFAALYIVVGFGLWSRQRWARIATVVLSVISLISVPIGTIIGILGIWLFGFQEDVRGVFG